MAKIISDENRSDWIIKNFGGSKLSFLLENTFYDVLYDSSDDYNGGYFDFVEEDNGVCWFKLITSDEKKFHVVGEYNYYDGEMSAEALSISGLLIALNRLCWKLYEDGENEKSMLFSEKFYALREFAAEHPEAGEIFKFID